MSSNIWTPQELQSSLTFYEKDVWRGVEDQHRASTMKLVGNSPSKQKILEDILERSKPPNLKDAAPYHWLLKTPFRYSPKRPGSRFRRHRDKKGVFYAAEDIETVLAELAFWKFVFLAESIDAPAPSVPVDYTLFRTPVRSESCLDAASGIFSERKSEWLLHADYTLCQSLCRDVRGVGGDVIRYHSLRSLFLGINVAVLDVSAFAMKQPYLDTQNWKFFIRKDKVIATKSFPRGEHEYPIEQFAADPRVAPLLNPRSSSTPR